MVRVPFIIACISVLFGCGDKDVKSNLTEEMLVVTGLQPGAGLLHLANDTSEFENHNLKVSIESKPSGKLAIKSVINNDVDADVILAADIAYLAHQHLLPNYRVVATVFDSDNANGIASLEPFLDISNIENKVLCTQYLSALHFFGQTLVERSGAKNVSFEFVNVAELNERLIDGDCDYITTREPFITDLAAKQDGAAYVKYFPGTYLQYELVLVHNRVPDEVVTRFLGALIRAESVIEERSDYAQAVLIENLKTDPKQLEKLLEESVLSVSLYQPLVTLFNRELVWLKSHGLYEEAIVNTRDMLRPEPLRDAAPLRQTIIDYEN
ncbi:hypothetical protein J4N45_08690 [Vibrio sp. SCSIO 43140]|uniref:ABC transporter substrate-binding protein n=1 Tax=Vibrio sp. SCSIO 43140 TaxID=2819100 RepID=UPI00207595E9|nr:hypothetical protein [Vibrio sp. SCSIO 43140]USD62015.1 hypothetical protein J4N45_08690 [Vibrio sp. SCSIO 43140]